MSVRRAASIVAAAAVGLMLTATPALASVAAEQQAGQKLADQVQSGQRTCKSLSTEDLDHIGEFVMGRMIGSTSAHEAMNARMVAVMGSQAESRMHQVLGARFVGCANAGTSSGTRTTAPGSMMDGGQGMMGSGSQSGGQARQWDRGDWGTMMGGQGNWGPMMNSATWSAMMGSQGDWNWMRGSAWKNMSTSDWHNVQQRLLGTAGNPSQHSGWDTRDTILLIAAIILGAGLIAVLVAWHPWRTSTT